MERDIFPAFSANQRLFYELEYNMAIVHLASASHDACANAIDFQVHAGRSMEG
jgi:hypothetical protein